MNTFNSMSDLVADADDLILSIGQSADPELQALKERLSSLIDAIRQRARQRIRRESAAGRQLNGATLPGTRHAPVLAIALGATIAMLTYRVIAGRRDRAGRPD